MSNYIPLEDVQSCHLCTFGECDFDQHPCDVCEYDPITGVNSRFRAILRHIIEEELTDDQSVNVCS